MQLAISGALGLIVLIIGWFVWRLNSRFKAALGGAKAQDLETSLSDYFKRVETAETKTREHSIELERLASQLQLASQKISIVRFNPFGDTGGDQSFSLAVLDGDNSGYVLTSIHSRETTRTYIKPVDGGVSKYTLSKEEQKAMEQAAKRIPRFTKSQEQHGQKD